MPSPRPACPSCRRYRSAGYSPACVCKASFTPCTTTPRRAGSYRAGQGRTYEHILSGRHTFHSRLTSHAAPAEACSAHTRLPNECAALTSAKRTEVSDAKGGGGARRARPGRRGALSWPSPHGTGAFSETRVSPFTRNTPPFPRQNGSQQHIASVRRECRRLAAAYRDTAAVGRSA